MENIVKKGAPGAAKRSGRVGERRKNGVGGYPVTAGWSRAEFLPTREVM